MSLISLFFATYFAFYCINRQLRFIVSFAAYCFLFDVFCFFSSSLIASGRF